MKRITIILLLLSLVIGVGYGQSPIKRKKSEKTEQGQSGSSSSSQHNTQNNRKKETKPIVKVSEHDGIINGHGYVDLGLPSGTLWATCNLGANFPQDKGHYYAWGEIETKSDYNQENYEFNRQLLSDLISKNVIGQNNQLTKSHDVASMRWGEDWEMPTESDFNELLSCCTWEWFNLKGQSGYLVRGKNNRTIFLPAAESSRYDTHDCGLYWVTTYHNSKYQLPDVKPLNFGEKYKCISEFGHGQWYGYSIRPITRKG